MTLVIELVIAAISILGIGGGSFYLFRKPTAVPTPPVFAPPPPTQIAAAIMSAINVGSLEGEKAKILHKVLEEAEVQAIHDCIAEGIDLHDAAPIIARKAAYREAAMDKFYGHQ